MIVTVICSLYFLLKTDDYFIREHILTVKQNRYDQQTFKAQILR